VAEGSIEKRVESVAERVAVENGFELVHVELAGPERNPIIRVFIDKPNGITHDDCAAMSLHLGTVLDVEDFIEPSYTLEVSSPGLERGLYKKADYERFAGHPAKMKPRIAINGQRNFSGKIQGLDGDDVVFDDKTNGQVRVPFDVIAKAHLEIDVEEEFRRAKEREPGEEHKTTE
jgi:ribosome maturation factor RimP